MGVLRRRRDGRTGIARCDRDGVAREARQPDLRHQLQPAAPRRSGARQRQDHPGTGRQLPRRRLEGDQGHLGLVLGSAAGEGPRGAAAPRDGRHRRRRIPELQGQRRRVRAQALLRQGSEAAGDGLADDRRRHLAAEPRRPRSAQDLRGVRGSHEGHGASHRHPREDRQGLRHGQGGGGQESDAPVEEARHDRDPRIPRSLCDSDSGRRSGGSAVLQAARGLARDEVPARAPAGARRLPAAAASQGRGETGRAGARRVPGGARADGGGPRDLDDAGIRAIADATGARQDDRAARGADHSGRSAHVRHGRHVPATRHLCRTGPVVRAGRQGSGDVLPRRQGGPDPRGRASTRRVR